MRWPLRARERRRKSSHIWRLCSAQHLGPCSSWAAAWKGLVVELLRHRPDRIDYVELDRTLLDVLTAHLPEEIAESLEAGPTQVTVADPRRFLHDGRSYDLILVGMPDPESGRTNRYYTREFFELCAEHLTGDGVLALRLRGAENLWTPQQTRRAASIHRALRAVFSDVVVLPGTTNTILASPSTLLRDPSVLGERLTDRGIEGRLVIPAYVDYLYTNDRFFEISELLDTADAPVNTDSRPVCYQTTQLIWLSKFFSRTGPAGDARADGARGGPPGRRSGLR